MVNWFLGKDLQQPEDNNSRQRRWRVPVVLIASVMLCVMGSLLIYHNFPSTEFSAPNAASRWLAPASRMTLPEMAIYASEGRPMRISQFYGRPMVVMLYTLDCRQCIESLRSLDALAQYYRSRVDFFAVGIVHEPSTGLQSVRYLLREHGIKVLTPYSIAETSVRNVISKSLPTTLVANSDDRVVLIHHGPGNWDTKDVRSQLDQMVAGR